MKYIQIFEEYNQYYSKIEYDEFENRKRESGIQVFNTEEITNLQNIIPEIHLRTEAGMKAKSVNYYAVETTSLSFTRDLFRYEVFKLPDEWYIVLCVSIDPFTKNKISYYKCDQFDGLLEFLKIL